jgi:hypothetical protein
MRFWRRTALERDKSMDEFDAEFKQMMADTQQEVNAEVYRSRAKYLRRFESAINGLLAVRLEDRTAEWRRTYKKFCLAFCLVSPYAMMRAEEARNRAGGKSLSYREHIQAVFGDYAPEWLKFYPNPGARIDES